MTAPLSSEALAQVFTAARTFNKFTDQEVSDATIQALYELVKWAPTSMNAQPARFVFLKTPAAKARLKPALAAGNADKTMAAPLCVIVAFDSDFHHHITEQFTAFDARPMFDDSPALTAITAFRNGSMQGAYLILAARSLGLDCGPMSGFDNGAVDEEFFSDGSFRSNFLINLGYGDASGNYPRGPRLGFETACQIL
jgi:3-hydroxypropanoate dehydrogenase